MKANVRRHLNLGIKVIFFCLFSTMLGYSQTRIADSLKILLPLKSGQERIDILYGLAYELVDSDYNLALSYARIGYQAAKQSGDSLRIVKAGRIKALAFRRLEMLDSSLALSLTILPIARRHLLNAELKSILNGLGFVSTEHAKYDKALEYYFESLELRKANGDEFDIAVIMNNIGVAYHKLRDYDNALHYFNSSIEIRKQIDNTYDFETPMLNAAIANAYKNNFEAAHGLLQEAMTFCSEKCSGTVLMQVAFTQGVIAFRQKNFLGAEKEFLVSLSIANTIRNERRFQLDNLIHLIQIYLNNGNLLSGEKYLQQAMKKISSAKGSYNREVMEIYRQFFLIYEQTNDLEKATFYQKKYIELKDTVYGDELAKNVMKIHAEHLEKENKAKIESQNKILALNEEIIIRQKYLNVFIGIITILLVLLSVILVRSNKKKQKLNQLLDKRVRQRTQELELNRDVLQRACDDRDALLHKIASDITSSIATIKGLCFLAKNDVREVDRYMEEVESASERFSQIVNKIVYNKIPTLN